MNRRLASSIALNLALLACAGCLLVERIKSMQGPGIRFEEPAGEQFGWAQVESTDYATYVANLRAIGCPERAIRSLVVDELAERFSRERSEITVRAPSGAVDAPASPQPVKQALQELESDQQRFLSEVLATQASRTSFEDAASSNGAAASPFGANAATFGASDGATTLAAANGQRVPAVETSVPGDAPGSPDGQAAATNDHADEPDRAPAELDLATTPAARRPRRDLFTPEQQRYRALWGWGGFYYEPAPAQ